MQVSARVASSRRWAFSSMFVQNMDENNRVTAVVCALAGYCEAPALHRQECLVDAAAIDAAQDVLLRRFGSSAPAINELVRFTLANLVRGRVWGGG